MTSESCMLLGGKAAGFASVIPLGAIHFGPIQFDRPVWLILLPIALGLIVWIGWRTIAGLGTFARWLAFIVRVIVVTLLVCTIAEPQWRKESKDVAVTVVMDVSQSVPGTEQTGTERYFDDASRANRKPDDRVGYVTVGRDAYVQSIPARLTNKLERVHIGAQDGTNLAGGLRMAMAVASKDAANRVVLVSDGRETVGSVLAAAEAFKAAGVPIDVLPVKYQHKSEVIVDRLDVPATARMGDPVGVRIVLNSTGPARGRLMITQNDVPIKLDPDSDSVSVPVELKAGVNVLQQQVKVPLAGPQEFKAVFQPDSPADDAILQNNNQSAVTFVSSQGRVLLISEDQSEYAAIVEALTAAKIGVEVRPADRFPATLTEMNGFDAVLMINEPASNFTQSQQDQLKQYVHDSGGGLVMVGGPNAFGAGGWIGSPVEDALPIKLDPPSKRQMPKGALVLVIHSVEIPEGVFYGKKVCEAAANSLSRQDMIGINEYNNARGKTDWTYPLAPVGDGSVLKQAIQKLAFGDMPDFRPSMELTYSALAKSDAGQKHAILISDGDPQHPGDDLLQKFAKAGISVSTIGIATHGAADTTNLKSIADATKGRFYNVAPGAVAQLPQIFIKEAQTVRRSLIWEGAAFSPASTGIPSQPMRGIGTPVPPINGYIVGAEREGLALVTLRGKENDPILALWQYGAGRSVAFTADVSTRWASAWTAWPQFRSFWEQHVRWAMRPSGSAFVRVNQVQEGESTRVTVEALDGKGERLNFANFKGRLALPGGGGQDVDLKQIGPGLYETTVRTTEAGSYVASLRYLAPGETEGETVEGSVQFAISRPFADEFRVLEDNTALLEQVRAMTGGRLLNADPKQADLFNREGLKMPVATRPIWLWAATIGIGLFLVDVAVRRVRIDPAMIAGGVKRLFRPTDAKQGEQIGSLKTARDAARRDIKRREGDAAVRSVKFEASVEQLKNASMPVNATSESAPIDVKPAKPASDAGQGQAPADGMSRLLKAKKRAQDDINE